MKLCLREATTLAAPPEAVWRVLAEPARRGEWNDKIVRVERRRSGAPVVGERYRLRYRLSGREREMEAEVVVCEAPRLLAVREHAPGDPERAVVVTWRLDADGAGTRISQEVDVTRAPIPGVVKLLMWIVSRTGKPRGATVVETLAELVLTEPDGR
ncbi:MAG: SRPBCC family protein [Deltaproteobacteria bacterium]|nr:SRPBCC family protein [Deltaproteobacteria bacterium]